MAVILFKNGKSEKFDEYTFADRLNEGWSLEDGITPRPSKTVEIEIQKSAPKARPKKRGRKAKK